MDSLCDNKLNDLESQLNGKHATALRELANRFQDATNRKINEQKA